MDARILVILAITFYTYPLDYKKISKSWKHKLN